MSPQLLFVDDDIPIRETLSLYFRKKGISVATAGSGNMTIRLAEKWRTPCQYLHSMNRSENGLDLSRLSPAVP